MRDDVKIDKKLLNPEVTLNFLTLGTFSTPKLNMRICLPKWYQTVIAYKMSSFCQTSKYSVELSFQIRNRLYENLENEWLTHTTWCSLILANVGWQWDCYSLRQLHLQLSSVQFSQAGTSVLWNRFQRLCIRYFGFSSSRNGPVYRWAYSANSLLTGSFARGGLLSSLQRNKTFSFWSGDVFISRCRMSREKHSAPDTRLLLVFLLRSKESHLKEP